VGGVVTTVPQTTTDPNVGWTYDATQNAIVFAPGSLPPSGATIDVSYYF